MDSVKIKIGTLIIIVIIVIMGCLVCGCVQVKLYNATFDENSGFTRNVTATLIDKSPIIFNHNYAFETDIGTLYVKNRTIFENCVVGQTYNMVCYSEGLYSKLYIMSAEENNFGWGFF